MLPFYSIRRGFWKELHPSGLRPRFQVRNYETLDYALKSEVPPIIIDPIEPEMIQEGLNQLLGKKLSTSEREMVESWLPRAKVYQTDKIRHYKMTLKEALAKHRDELLGRADLVMDLFGVWYYQWWRRPKYELILKPDGLGLVWASNTWSKTH